MKNLQSVAGGSWAGLSSFKQWGMIVLAAGWITTSAAQPATGISTNHSAMLVGAPINTTVTLPASPAVSSASVDGSTMALVMEKQLLDFQGIMAQSEKDSQTFFQTEAERHQKFLEWYYELCVKIISGGIVLFGALLAFFQFKSIREIKDIVNARIDSKFNSVMEEKIRSIEATFKQQAQVSLTNFNGHLEDHKNMVATKVKNLESEFKGGIQNSITLATALARACALFNLPSSSNTDQERRDTIKSLEKIQKEWAPTNRTIAVFIGRLHKTLGELDQAVAALEAVLKERVKHGEDHGRHIQDHADIMYNTACYLNIMANNAKTGSETIRKQAWETIKKSIELWPANLEEARKDEDFDGLTNDVRRWDKLQPE